MFSQLVLFSLLSLVGGTAVVDIQAVGTIPTGSGAAAAVGSGATVTGDTIVSLTDTSSISTAVITATGTRTSAPTPVPTLVPTPKPVKPTKPGVKVHTPPKVVVPSKYYKEPVCEDIKDDKCYSIDDYTYCGFCIKEKYPLKGYACKYTKEKVLKKSSTGSSKKVYENEYETVITPKCKCDGDFILKGELCPGCDYLLSLLLKCAGIKDSKNGELEIPEKCLKEVGVKVEDLIKCEYVKAPSPSKKDKVDPPAKKVVIVPPKVYEDPKKVVVVPPTKKVKKDPKVVQVPAKASSSASASASASATGKDAVASASASASAGGN